MTILRNLHEAAGDWQGTNLMRMMPDDEYSPSAATASVGVAAGGHAVTVAYTWSHEGEPQDGVLLVTAGREPGTAAVAWIDSWHQNPHWMVCEGRLGDDGDIRVEGSYGRDAGWRLRLGAAGGRSLRIAMDNLGPGMDYQVVDASFSR
ncbi:DUF1579 family protein [Amycolatopsis antarctica]|uniref:DUF1579 family protein n=1 Tax=Amycolatopsis antarctica TaxID=1854586 RepID=UPI00196AE631|nr:DUF1579 family protein [Amycolatopsis antarctica]